MAARLRRDPCPIGAVALLLTLSLALLRPAAAQPYPPGPIHTQPLRITVAPPPARDLDSPGAAAAAEVATAGGLWGPVYGTNATAGTLDDKFRHRCGSPTVPFSEERYGMVFTYGYIFGHSSACGRGAVVECRDGAICPAGRSVLIQIRGDCDCRTSACMEQGVPGCVGGDMILEPSTYREIAGVDAAQLPSFPVAWQFADCGSRQPPTIFMNATVSWFTNNRGLNTSAVSVFFTWQRQNITALAVNGQNATAVFAAHTGVPNGVWNLPTDPDDESGHIEPTAPATLHLTGDDGQVLEARVANVTASQDLGTNFKPDPVAAGGRRHL